MAIKVGTMANDIDPMIFPDQHKRQFQADAYAVAAEALAGWSYDDDSYARNEFVSKVIYS